MRHICPVDLHENCRQKVRRQFPPSIVALDRSTLYIDVRDCSTSIRRSCTRPVIMASRSYSQPLSTVPATKKSLSSVRQCHVVPLPLHRARCRLHHTMSRNRTRIWMLSGWQTMIACTAALLLMSTYRVTSIGAHAASAAAATSTHVIISNVQPRYSTTGKSYMYGIVLYQTVIGIRVR